MIRLAGGVVTICGILAITLGSGRASAREPDAGTTDANGTDTAVTDTLATDSPVTAVSPADTSDSSDTAPLTLTQTLELALQNNPRILKARQGVEEAEADLDIAEAEYQPRIEFQALLAPMTGHHVPDAATPFQNSYSTDLGDLGEWGIWTKINVKLVQPIYTCGKITWLNRARRLGVDVSRGLEAMAAADVRLEVLKAHFGLALTRRLTGVLGEGREYFDKARTHLRELEENDDPSFDPVDQMKVNVYEAQIIDQEMSARRMKDLAGGQLRRLVGGDPLSALDFVTADEPQPVVPEVELDLETAVASAMENRPELLALRTGIEAREAEAEARFRNFFPDFVLFGEFEYAYSNVADDLSFPYSDPFNTLGFGFGLAMRFDLNIGAKMGQFRKTNAARTGLQAELDGAETSVRLEVGKLFAEMQDARSMLSTRETALKSARGWVIAKTDLFENDMASLQEVIDGLTQFFLAQLAYHQAIYDYNVSVATLERATGVELVPLSALDVAN